MEILLACVFAYWLMRHGPQLIAEAIAELEYARRGEMSPLAEARLKRLLDAGVDPAFGGPMRQFFGNAWRDLWLGLDEERRTRPRSGPHAGLGWRDRLRGCLDDAVDGWADRWRHRSAATDAADTAPHGGPDEASDVPDEPSMDADPSDGPERADDEPLVEEDWSAHLDEDIDLDAAADPDEPAPADDFTPPAEPIRVASTVGDPIPDTPASAAPERTEPMNAVVHVTGVTSGAAEARAIERQIQEATNAYVAAIAAARRRIQHLGEATLGEIQQAVHSRVVNALQAAAEAAAAAEHAARTCAGEVGPQLIGVARQFDRISS